MGDGDNYHIQMTCRHGALVIEGPDPAWVEKQAERAWRKLRNVKGSPRIGFAIEPGGTSTLETVTPERNWALGERGPEAP